MSDFTKISGIGKVLADKLRAQGAKNASDLKKKKYFDQLPIQAKVDLMHKPLKKIPHQLIVTIHAELKKMLKGYKFEITGSYRRKTPFSSDIDCLIIGATWSEIMTKVNKSRKIKLLAPYMQGEDRMSTLMDVSKLVGKSTFVKIDFFNATKDNYVFNLLYSTGSKEFNIRMRSHAKNKGYLLNQNGLYKVDPSNPNVVHIIKAATEQEVFALLGMKWLPPEKR